ncbi:12094_t:CDS:2, partial [Racocetra persica]
SDIPVLQVYFDDETDNVPIPDLVIICPYRFTIRCIYDQNTKHEKSCLQYFKNFEKADPLTFHDSENRFSILNNYAMDSYVTTLDIHINSTDYGTLDSATYMTIWLFDGETDASLPKDQISITIYLQSTVLTKSVQQRLHTVYNAFGSFGGVWTVLAGICTAIF